jgi:hypothetical protein
MEKILYGFIPDGNDENINHMLIFSSLEELWDDVNEPTEGTVFIFELKQTGIVDIGDVKFTPKIEKATKKSK